MIKFLASLQDVFVYTLDVVRVRATMVGACGLALLCIGVLLFDGLVFYAYVLRPRSTVIDSQKKIVLSEQEVVNVMKLVDDRQKKFNEILDTDIFGAERAAFSTSTQPVQRAPASRTR